MRSGFTFVEVIVAVGVTAIIGSTVYVSLAGARDRQRVDESYDILHHLSRVIDRFDTTTSNIASGGGTALLNGRHPRSLVQLNNALTSVQVAGCTDCTNLCNVAYTGTPHVIGWAGPHFQVRDVTVKDGFRIPIGLVRDTLIRDPAATPGDPAKTYGLLKIRIDSVAYVDALDLKGVVDGAVDSTKGVVRWETDAVNGVLSYIYWTLPLAGC